MAKPREFDDFVLELRDYDPAADTYTAALAAGQGWGEPEPVKKIKLDQAAMEVSLRRLEERMIKDDDLFSLGKWLMDRLLPEGDLRQLFVNAVKSIQPEQGIRLRLVTRDTVLAQLPWEYSYLKLQDGPEDRTHFLALNPKVSLVRHTPINSPLPDLAPADPKNWRLLVAMASPEAQGFAPLSLGREEFVLDNALGNFKVEDTVITWQPVLRDITAAGLSNALLEKPQIFHFAGHGQYKPTDDAATLVVLEDDGSKAPHFLPAAEIAKKLQTAGVRLAYLGACQSSRQHGINPWTAIAPALAASGIPAVIAMQYEVIDEMAIVFAEAFYNVLAVGLTVDEAVTIARLAVLDKSPERGIQWGVPTLYLRSPDGILFPEVTSQPSAARDALQAKVKMIIGTIEAGGKVVGIRFKKVPGSGTFTVEQNVIIVRGENIGIDM